MTYKPWHEISNNLVCATSKGSDQPAHTRSLIRAFACRLSIVKLLAEHHFELPSLTGGCRGSSGSTHVKMLHCWKARALAHMILSANCSNHLKIPILLVATLSKRHIIILPVT